MSNVFEGPGWWMASDGKWYAPHLHHDQIYRSRFAQPTDEHAGIEIADQASSDPVTKIVTPPEPHLPFGSTAPASEVEPAVAEPAAAVVVEAVDSALDRPTADVGPRLGSMPMPVVTPVPGSVSEMLTGEKAAGWAPAKAQPDIDPDRLVGFREKETFSRPIPVSEILDAQVAEPIAPDDEIDELESVEKAELLATVAGVDEAEAEVFLGEVHLAAETEHSVDVARSVDVAPPQADEEVWETLTVEVDEAVTRDESPLVSLDLMGGESAAAVAEPQAMRAKLEVGQNQPDSADPHLRRSDSTTRLSTSTDLVPVSIPAGVLGDEPITWYDRAVALTLFLAGIAMIVGTFVSWIDEPGVTTSGWDLGDGVATIVAGVLGSAAAGPIFVGFRHIVPKTIAIIAGIVGIVVAGLTGLRTLTDSDAAATSLGIGFWVVLAGSIAMLAAGLFDRSRIGD